MSNKRLYALIGNKILPREQSFFYLIAISKQATPLTYNGLARNGESIVSYPDEGIGVTLTEF